MNVKKLVIFDLDGTLNKTELFAVPAHQKALAELGITNISDEEIIETFGARAEDSAGKLIGSNKKEDIINYLKKTSLYEKEFILTRAESFKGVPQMLAKLKDDSYITAICSNASERYIKMVLSALHIEDKIDEIQSLLPDLLKDDTLRLLLSKIKPNKAVMVGDRIYDKNAAKTNHIPFIGCMYGFKKEEIINADITVNNPNEINTAVKNLIG